MSCPQSYARLQIELLEDRSTPSGSQIPAGEFNWTQVSPGGSLTQLVWEGSALVYRVRTGSTWSEETVAIESGTFTRASYDTPNQVEAATQSAQLVYTTDGTAARFFPGPAVGAFRQWLSIADRAHGA